MAEYYESSEDYSKFEHYNLEALEYKENIEEKRRAKIYKRQASAEMLNSKYQEALTNIQSAIDIEPFNTRFLLLKIEILIYLNKVDNLFLEIQRTIKELKDKKDTLSLVDAYILMAKYHGKKQNEEDALSYFHKAHSLIKEYSDDIYAYKKSYILAQIANIEGDEDKIIDNTITEEALNKAEEAIRLKTSKDFIHRTRLDSIEIAYQLNEKGLLLHRNVKYEKAKPIYLKSLKITQVIMGQNHPNTAQSYNNLAGLYHLMGKYEKAKSLHRKALKIRQEILGENHPDTALSYNNLAGLYYEMGKIVERVWK